MGPDGLQVFPAGWLCATSEGHAMDLIEKVANSIKRLKAHPTIIFGVDGWLDGKKKLISSPSGYPFWICVIRSNDERHLFQQIDISNKYEKYSTKDYPRRPAGWSPINTSAGGERPGRDGYTQTSVSQDRKCVCYGHHGAAGFRQIEPDKLHHQRISPKRYEGCRGGH